MVQYPNSDWWLLLAALGVHRVPLRRGPGLPVFDTQMHLGSWLHVGSALPTYTSENVGLPDFSLCVSFAK